MGNNLSWLKRWLPALVGIFLLSLLVGLGVWLYLKTRLVEAPPAPVVEAPVVTPLVNQPGVPVKKGISQDNLGFSYELEGSFVGEIARDETRPDKAWRGQLVLRGDSMKRQIPILLISPTGIVAFGRFESSLSGESVWRSVRVDEVAAEVKPGEPVQVVIQYSLPGPARAGMEVPTYFQEIQQVLDGLAKEFDGRNFSLTIPEGFFLIANGLGVVR